MALVSSMAFSAHAADVIAFTDTQHAVSNANGIRVVLLDAPANLEAALGAQLPANSAQAEAIVRRRLAQGGADLQRQLADAYQGVADAWGLGVAKIPAVVVDHRYVVYGEPDVTHAVDRIHAYRSTQP
ncbi:TIGR03757 family integrating conjugative element protein [Burkholderia multivorans]|uniref:TIGR03757 family integrating conjugative element protein n=1 Tax=Burkholderiaceae TaxID=119060 RepID=UPI001ABA3F43|nr:MULTISPECIES: TIGR03757 family integrating conjugative element protein [Burkholderia cepacia complex]MCO8318104.1 TIGR03757 family integrating conjugative element protein [Burkholderia multivorans]MCO8550438.1 TIGR03757 family integrating conjugative element protein [Burkholderia multivorans]MCO8557846.1 TIGR03757 family integrating conjugative element protein [Burkholderia multivorans]MCO8621418.1 TIGR03757 family integrating conjugative element protein [Burkholderia multivorans]